MGKDAEFEGQLLAQAIAALSQATASDNHAAGGTVGTAMTLATDMLRDLQQKRQGNAEFYQQVLAAAAQAL
jgi:hypothetical protein